ncbi:MAG TPA: hypothetical protein VGG10_08720 [Rhizomicrobium sp.]|jgi:hypothetical protein
MTGASRSRVLNAALIVQTVERLHSRIDERFPGSGLSALCADLQETARTTAVHVADLARPYYGLRAVAVLVALAGIGAEVYAASLIHWSAIFQKADDVALSQGLDAAVNLLLLSFGAIWFMLTLETRLKRRAVLKDLYVLRSLAHVVDMHQLTKDPTVVLGGLAPTASSPERRMSEFELSRYLDYCGEMLALIAKLGALYVAKVDDPAVIAAVNEIEELTSDLGRKIWQKIMIVSRLDEKRQP